MAKRQKKSTGSSRVSWKTEAERAEREVSKLVGLLTERDNLLGERAEELRQEKVKVAELEANVTGLETEKAELLNDWRGAVKDRNRFRQKTIKAEIECDVLKLEIAERRRLAGILAIFHHAGKSVEDCFDEFQSIADLVGVKPGEFSRSHMGEAYKAAGRRIHRLVYEHGVRLTPSEVTLEMPKDPIERVTADLERAIAHSRRVVMDRMRGR